MSHNGNDDSWTSGYRGYQPDYGSSADENFRYQQGVQQRQREEQARSNQNWGTQGGTSSNK